MKRLMLEHESHAFGAFIFIEVPDEVAAAMLAELFLLNALKIYFEYYDSVETNKERFKIVCDNILSDYGAESSAWSVLDCASNLVVDREEGEIEGEELDLSIEGVYGHFTPKPKAVVLPFKSPKIKATVLPFTRGRR